MNDLNMPGWAYYIPGAQMIRGADLRQADILRFSADSYPRVLWKQIDERRWSVVVLKPFRDTKEQLTIDARRWYVVVRAAVPPKADGISPCTLCGEELPEWKLCPACGGCVADCCTCPTEQSDDDTQPDPHFFADLYEDEHKLRYRAGGVR